ncbi:MAG: nucleotidyltransferase domain-containing protein [Methanoregula sp.]|nr:nucleotidyltransferase domain-containing protein [Methanoregula sp.]
MDTVLSRIVDVIIRTLDPDTIILFGSRACGDAHENSDFDICVLKKEYPQRRTIACTLYRALYGVGAPVELIIDTPATLRKYKDNPHLIYREIARDGKIIYEKSHAG